LIWSITDSISAARKNDEIRNLVVFNQDLNKANAESAGADNEEVIEEKESVIVQTEDGTEILSDYSKLYEVNSDFIGWLSVENTSIAYPIVFTDNNDYYLTRDFFGNEDRHGTVFADYRSDLSEESSNIIMYGHRMRDGSMFGILSEYENKDYFEKHPIIEFDSRTERHSYEIIAVFKSEIFFENDDVFKYYQYTYIGSEEEFESYYNGVKDISLYDTGVTAEYGDHLITLSTCDYSVPDGRLALVAKRIE
jgi:sortase B